MKKCLNCQREYPDEQIYCNECGSTLQIGITQIANNETVANKKAENKERKSKKKALIVSIISTILACCFLAASVYFYNEYSYYENKYDWQWSQNFDLQEELEEYKNRYDYIEKAIATGTNKYYPEKYIINISRGKTYSLAIYSNLNNTIRFHQQTDGISCTWSKEWNDNTTHLYIEAITKGVQAIDFTNDENSDKFTVIVIVD